MTMQPLKILAFKLHDSMHAYANVEELSEEQENVAEQRFISINSLLNSWIILFDPGVAVWLTYSQDGITFWLCHLKITLDLLFASFAPNYNIPLQT